MFHQRRESQPQNSRDGVNVSLAAQAPAQIAGGQRAHHVNA